MVQCFKRLLVYFAMTISSQHISNGKQMQHEFGNVLTQGAYPVKATDKLRQKIIEFSENYARKRLHWCSPSSKQMPDVLHFEKKALIYSHDNVIPLFHDDIIADRDGNQHGITSLITLGTMYHFLLTWRDSILKYTHNFTISVLQRDQFHVYSHTCFVQNMNLTSTSGPMAKDWNNIHFGESYFKTFIKLDLKDGNDFSYRDIDIQRNYNQHNDYSRKGDYFKTKAGPDETESDGTTVRTEYISKIKGSQSVHRFSVMSYNIWNMNSKSRKREGYTERMKRLKKVIEDVDPDIIGLQEVRYEEQKGDSLGPCQIHTLSHWLPQYQYVYQPAQMQPNTLHDGRTEEGVAIMSKYPIISHDFIKLFINRSNSADTHQRILLHVEIYIPFIGQVHMFTTHLSLSHEAREESVIEILDQLGLVDGPAIVLGDFNAEPHEPAMQYMRGVLNNHNVRSVDKLTDLWTYIHNDTDKGFTYNALEKKLTKRIDYMLFRGWEDCCVIDRCDVVDNGSRGLAAASDHIPIVAVFSKVLKPVYQENSSFA